MEFLTLEGLESIEPKTIFAKGILMDNPFDINIANTGNEVKWVAVRGDVNDWAIYAQNPHEGSLKHDFDYIKRCGDKVYGESNIRKLVLCDDAAFKRYRL